MLSRFRIAPGVAGASKCHVVECDALVDGYGFEWLGPNGARASGRLPVGGGEAVDPGEATVLWWRRASLPQLEAGEPYSYENAFVTAEWRHALLGVLLGRFRGAWISDPAATRTAANKLLQLETAASLGWQVPPTLVSQDRARIHEFCLEAPKREVVVKALGATRGRTMASVAARWEDLEQSDLGLCSAVYQHRMPGDRHLRINCFGERVEAFRIETPVMDWRRDHTAAIHHVDLDGETAARARALVERLGLSMGVIDAKLLDDGLPCFFDVNPQGQFLFLQAATGVDLVDACTEFLVGRDRADSTVPSTTSTSESSESRTRDSGEHDDLTGDFSAVR